MLRGFIETLGFRTCTNVSLSYLKRDPEVVKPFFMRNSNEHACKAHNYQNNIILMKFSLIYMLKLLKTESLSLLKNVKMPTYKQNDLHFILTFSAEQLKHKLS